MSMEQIVRPFFPPSVFTARSNVPTQADTVAPETSVLEWKGEQTANWVEAPPPATMGFNVTWDEDKSRRITESVRVENPEDSTQFVELERIKQTVFKNNVTGEEIPLKLDWA